MDKNINLVVSADLSQLESGIASVSTSVNTLQTETQKLGQTTKQVFGTAGENADKYAQNFNDIQTKIAELNEKLRNEIALKKQSQTVTAQRIQQLVKERDAIEKQALAMTKTQTGAQKLSSIFAKLGITISAAFAVRAIIRFTQASIKAYDESIAAETKLLTALKGRVNLQQELLQQAAELQKSTRFGDEQVIDVQTRLAKSLRGNGDAIKQLTPLILDFATAQGVDAAGAADLVSKAFLGSTAALGRYGIKIDATATEEQKLAQITEKLTTLFGGQAKAVGEVGSGAFIKLKNQFDDLREAYGERSVRGLQIWTKALSGLVSDLTTFTKIPLSEKLEDEREKVNGLVTALISQKDNAEARNKLYNELNRIAPDVVANINQESISVSTLTNNLRNYNKQQINRIILQENFEKLQQAQNKEADATMSVIDMEIKAGQLAADVEKRLIDAKSSQIELLKTARLNYESGAITILQYVDAVKIAAEAADVLNQSTGDYLGFDLETFADTYATSLKIQTNSVVDGIKAQETFNEVQTRLGITLDDLTVKTNEVTTAEDNNNKATKETTTEYEKLTAEIDKLNKLYIDQILLKDINAEQTAKEIIELEKQKEAIDKSAEQIRARLRESGLLNLEIVPFIKSESLLTIQQNLSESIPEELQKSESAFGKAALESGEKAGESWLDGFLMSIIEFKDDKQLQDLKSALDQALNFIVKTSIDLLTQFDDSAITGLELLIQGLDDRIAATDDALNREFELKKQGFANNYELERENLAALNALREKAQADRDAQIEKQRQAEQTATVIQTVAASITTVAKAYQDYDPLVATIIATLALGSLIGLIASAKSQGESAAQFAGGYADILGGNSHAGGGVSLGELGEAEGGEFIGIGSKKATNKYGKGLKSLFDGINTANSDKIAAGIGSITLKSGIMESGDVNHNISLNEIPEIKDIRNILKRQTGTVIYENGRRIEKSGGKTRIINVN